MYATGTQDASKSHVAGSPVYQIDFTAVDSGKRIASTKRRIRWRFGFSNADALAAGETGTNCRGEEHDITLIWSITSGKRLVLADGQEVHYSNNRSHLFDFSWTMRGNHVLKVIAHANPPANASQTFRQYDFFVDGMSFFNMPKVYRLGLIGAVPTHEPAGNLALATTTRGKAGTAAGYQNYSVPPNERPGLDDKKKSVIADFEAPHNRDEEQAYLAEAIKNSLNEKPGHSDNRSLPPPKQNDLLVDMMSEPGIPTTPMDQPRPTLAEGVKPVANVSFRQEAQVPRYEQSTNPNPSFPQQTYQQNFQTSAPATSSATTGQPPMAPNPFEAAPVPSLYATAPVPSPYITAPAPTSGPSPYAAAAAPPSYTPGTAPVPALVTNPYAATTPAPPPHTAATPAPPPYTAAPAPSMFNSAPVAPTPVEPDAPTHPEPVKTPPEPPTLTMSPEPAGLGSDANAAFAKFANMDQFDLISKASNATDAKDRDNPFEDVASKAPAPTLAGMKMMGAPTEKKEVMKANPDVMPGALVLSGSQSGQWSAYNGLGSQAPGLNNGMVSQGYGQIGGGAVSNGSVASSIPSMTYGQMGNGSVAGSLTQPQQYYGMSNNPNGAMNMQYQQQQPQQAHQQQYQQYGFQQGNAQQGNGQQPQATQGYGYGAQQPN